MSKNDFLIGTIYLSVFDVTIVLDNLLTNIVKIEHEGTSKLRGKYYQEKNLSELKYIGSIFYKIQS